MKLVIAEKPSVAISIAKVIGANKKKDGYYEGNGYRVSWCVGHLIQMANPDAYDEKYAKWNMADLPIIPSDYKYEVAKATKKQFNILKKLMNDKEVDTVINACDAGREGESIFRLVYNQVNCKKKMKRLWISSMEDSAIKEGFDNLTDGKDYDNLFESAQARAIADWLVGMNISRLYSCLYQQNYSVGRVQTPTLAMIVKRDDEIANYQKEKYYTVELSMNGFTLSTDRIDDEVAAEQLISLVGDKIEITDVIQKEKITKPDLPFDLTTLQRECNKYFGYSAKQTLDYAQSLYEKKLITYPRTDSRYLTADIKDELPGILKAMDFGVFSQVVKYALTRDVPDKYFNDKKVTDHHALIPTVPDVDFEGVYNELSYREKNVFNVVFKRFISLFMPNYEYESIEAILKDENDFSFLVKGKNDKELGFKKLFPKSKKDANDKEEFLQELSISEEEIFIVTDKEVVNTKTKPKSRFTTANLLDFMKVSNIGTGATRDTLIKELTEAKGGNKDSFVKKEGKFYVSTNFESVGCKRTPNHAGRIRRG